MLTSDEWGRELEAKARHEWQVYRIVSLSRVVRTVAEGHYCGHVVAALKNKRPDTEAEPFVAVYAWESECGDVPDHPHLLYLDGAEIEAFERTFAAWRDIAGADPSI